jgi:hypothetical protein
LRAFGLASPYALGYQEQLTSTVNAMALGVPVIGLALWDLSAARGSN